MSAKLYKRGAVLLLVGGIVLLTAGCVSSLGGWHGSPESVSGPSAGRYPLANETLKRMESADPSLKSFVNNAYGYAVFPTVGKGGIGIGGAYGEGGLFHGGVMTARCRLYQATIGFQLGGQSYSELIFFKDKEKYIAFKNGQFAFAGQASAVAVTAGAAANAAYNGGVAVFTLTKAGLMYEASIGGQKFSCTATKAKSR